MLFLAHELRELLGEGKYPAFFNPKESLPTRSEMMKGIALAACTGAGILALASWSVAAPAAATIPEVTTERIDMVRSMEDFFGTSFEGGEGRIVDIKFGLSEDGQLLIAYYGWADPAGEVTISDVREQCSVVFETLEEVRGFHVETKSGLTWIDEIRFGIDKANEIQIVGLKGVSEYGVPFETGVLSSTTQVNQIPSCKTKMKTVCQRPAVCGMVACMQMTSGGPCFCGLINCPLVTVIYCQLGPCPIIPPGIGRKCCATPPCGCLC